MAIYLNEGTAEQLYESIRQRIAEMEAKSIQSYLYGSWDVDAPLVAKAPVGTADIDALCPEPKCTCGVQHTGGIHSDWCDLDETA